MSRAQEILIGIAIIVGGIIGYPWIMDNLWDDLIAPNLIAVAPDNAWGDAFLAGVPIGFLILIIGVGVLFIVGVMHSEDNKYTKR